MSVIVIPHSETVPMRDVDGTSGRGIAPDDGSATIASVGRVVLAQANIEREGVSNRRVAWSHPFPTEATDALKQQVASVEVLDALPGDWRPEASE